jgi:hypothetical protein
MADSVQYKSLPEVLYCKTCNYYTCNKKQIEKHFLSNKHIKNISISVELPPSPPPPTAVEPMIIEDISPSDSDIPLPPPNTPSPLICDCCGKIYKRKRALLRHQQSKQQEQQEAQEQLEQPETKNNNSSLDEQENDIQSLELISDGGGEESSNTEFEYITIEPLILDPLIINNDVMYFMQVFVYSIDVVMGISVFINKIFSFFSLKSDDDIN